MKSYRPTSVAFHLKNVICNLIVTFDIKFTWETSYKLIEAITTSQEHERVYFERTVDTSSGTFTFVALIQLVAGQMGMQGRFPRPLTPSIQTFSIEISQITGVRKMQTSWETE